MPSLPAVLDSRATFLLSALIVTWVGFALLALITARLHLRLRRLEVGNPTRAGAGARSSFARLVGSDGAALFGQQAPGATVNLLLSRGCRSCARVLDELAQGALGEVRIAVAWVDGPPDAAARLPAGVEMLDTGPDIAHRVGVRVTPFAIAMDEHGTVIDARAVASIADLRRMLHTHVGALGVPAREQSDLHSPRPTANAPS